MRLIDADTFLKDVLPECKYPDALRDAVERQPTIEAEPVRHGRWDEMQCFSEHGIEMASYECTSCGNDIERQRGLVPPYCEFCGAKMEGGAENDT